MGLTKRECAEGALNVLALANSQIDIEEKDFATVIFFMEGMIAGWMVQGIDFGYNLSDTPDISDADQDSNIPTIAQTAVFYNLALLIAPMWGKTIPGTFPKIAKETFESIRLLYLDIESAVLVRPRTQILGAGSRNYYFPNYPFVPVRNKNCRCD